MPGNKQVFSTAMNTADRYRWDSQWTLATQEYQRALAEFPDDAMARGGLGFCYMQTKQWQQALHEYEYTLQRDPGNVIALSKTAELYGILNRRDDAYRAYLHLADLYSQAGQGARAEAAWQKAVQLSPGDPEPHERLATYYAGKKDIPMMLQERLAAAQGYLLRDDSNAARVQCEEVLRTDATNRQAQQLLTQIMGGQPSAISPFPQERGTADNGTRSGPLAFSSSSQPEMATTGNIGSNGNPGNTSGGNTGNMGNMGNMGSAGNFGGVGNPGPAFTANSVAGGGMPPSNRQRITASQVTGVLKQAQTFQAQGRFNDAIDLCEQILESGFDRPDARYFLGWLYQEQQRWQQAIQQFQMLLNDPDYALSCYYALGQCYRALGDLRTAAVHFDEAVDRVNLDALTPEESDQLVQLCEEAAEAHRQLGEQEQALTVYNALLGFLRSRGWSDKVAQVEFMLQQVRNVQNVQAQQNGQIGQNGQQLQKAWNTPDPASAQQAMNGATAIIPPEQMAAMHPPQPATQDAPTMAFNAANIPPASAQLPAPAAPATNNTMGELPDWLTGILGDADKSQMGQQPKPRTSTQSPAPTASTAQAASAQSPQSFVADQPTTEQRIPMNAVNAANTVNDSLSATEAQAFNPAPPAPQAPTVAASSTWLNEDAKPGNDTRIVQPEAQPQSPPMTPEPVNQPSSAQDMMVPPARPLPSEIPATPFISPEIEQYSPVLQSPVTKATKESKENAEDLLSQMAGASGKDKALKQVAEAVLASTATLPDSIRLQVVQSMRDIQRYINHGLLTPATEECLHVIDIAPQYLDVHQILCEIYVRQGKVEQAITKYAILVDTYIVNGRVDDAIATYRRILQLEPNNLTYRMRLIQLLSTHGNKEDLLHERTLAAESYLRLGYMDRAQTELEQALQESPTSVPTRLNYALALQKLGRTQQAVAEYQRVLQVDPRNITALIRWHIAMITSLGTGRATALETLTRVRWQLRGEGQRLYSSVVREYAQATETYPNNADVHFALGQMHQQAGNYEKAIDAYQLAMRDSAVEVMAEVSAAQCLLAEGKPEPAIQQLEQALQNVRRVPTGSIDPSIWAARPREEDEEHSAPEVEISLLLAKAYGRTGKQEQMQAILRQVKQSTTHQDEVSSTLAEISARQGDVESALHEYADLIHHYRNKRQIESALSVLNEMVRMAPQDPRAHDELADIYVNRGLLEEAIAELRVLADIYQRRDQDEKAGETYQRIGTIYAEAGNIEDALVNLRRAADLMPESLELLREIVGFCLQLGQSEEAAEYQVIIARHYFDTHQVKESVAALQQLITIDRGNFEAYDLLGQTYQSVGEYEQASRVYRNLAKVNPENPIARERLATLQELRAK
ncbi:MAG: tetratricopeptide repeat protein [Ktedonobacteraceae bacterium]